MIQLTEERLSVSKHMNAVGDFMCGPDNPLDTFLMTDAFKYDEERYGNTYVLTYGQNIVAFYTLKTSGIQVREDDEFVSIPVVELARIAIQHEFQGKGIGKLIFYEYILPKILRVSKIVAVKAIIAFVESDDSNAVRYYKSLGFDKPTDIVQKEIEEAFNEECDLYLVSLDNIEDKKKSKIGF